MDKLIEVAKKALTEMCRVAAPDSHFTDVVDELDAAITEAESAQQSVQADECQEPCTLGGAHEFAPPVQICSKCGTRR